MPLTEGNPNSEHSLDDTLNYSIVSWILELYGYFGLKLNNRYILPNLTLGITILNQKKKTTLSAQSVWQKKR
jgi:hypothetical protein